MEKALLEEHVRYGEARFKDKKLVRPFVNRIYKDLEELEEAMNLTRREWYQKGFNEAMKQRTCEGCKHKPNDGECYYEPCGTCARFFYDNYEPKVTP